jgi:hypothetical protein
MTVVVQNVCFWFWMDNMAEQDMLYGVVEGASEDKSNEGDSKDVVFSGLLKDGNDDVEESEMVMEREPEAMLLPAVIG